MNNVEHVKERLVAVSGLNLSWSEHPLVKQIDDAQSVYDVDRQKGLIAAAQIFAVVEDLEAIKQFNPEALKGLLRKFCVTQVPTAQYFGIRTEIDVAAVLSRKTTSFLLSEAPDLIVGTIGIECTSSQINDLATPREGSKIYKIRETIAAKNLKKHSTKHTILEVNITNLMSHEGSLPDEDRQLIDVDILRPALQADVDGSQFESVICRAYAKLNNAPSSGTVERVYSRIDRSEIESNIKSFIDSIHPLGDWRKPAFFSKTV